MQVMSKWHAAAFLRVSYITCLFLQVHFLIPMEKNYLISLILRWMGDGYFVCNYSSQFKQGKNIFKLLFLGAKLNQVSSPLKKIKLLLCKSVLMRTELADSDKWQWHQREHVSRTICACYSLTAYFSLTILNDFAVS